jgi:outer membrane protein insertion porin family
VETPPVPGTIDLVDVNVNVTEKSTGNISIGAGYSSAEKVILSGSISQSNIFGSGKFLSLQVNTGKLNRTLGINYTNPYFTVDGISQGFDLYDRKLNPTSLGYAFQSSHRRRYPLRLPDRREGNAQLRTGGRSDDDRHHSRHGSHAAPVHQVPGRTRRLEHHAAGDRLVDQRYPKQLDLSDHWRHPACRPSKWPIPGVDLSFYRLTYKNERYFSLTKDLVLMLMGELGYANGLQRSDLAVLQELLRRRYQFGARLSTASLGPVDPLYPGYLSRRYQQGGVQCRVADAAAGIRQVGSLRSIL